MSTSGKFVTAIRRFLRVPHWKFKSLSPSFSDLVARGDAARDKRDWAEAERHYSAARELQPNDDRVVVQLGHALKEMGHLDAAEQAYRDALSQQPFKADTWLMLGHCLKLQKRPDDALDAYASAYHLDPCSEDSLREIVMMQALDRIRSVTGINNSRLQRLIADLQDAKTSIDRLIDGLPSLTSFASFGLANYDLYRKIFRIPPPAASLGDDVRLSLSIRLADWNGLALRRFLTSLTDQSFTRWTLSIEGGQSSHRSIAALAAAGEHRITLDAQPEVASWHIQLPPNFILDVNALAWFAWAVAETEPEVVYCDYDCVDGRGFHSSPSLKGMFDPLSGPKFLNLPDSIVAKRHTSAVPRGAPISAHIPLPLASRLAEVGSPNPPAKSPVEMPTVHTVSVSVIIPTRDHVELLRPCIASLVSKAGSNADFEIIIVDNGTTDAKTAAFLRDGAHSKSFSVLRVEEPFNWARLNNLAAKHAQKNLLLFINNDTVFLSDDWNRVLSDLFSNPSVGAAGARLLYEDNTIQHAGILFGFEHLAMHDGKGADGNTPGPDGRWSKRRSTSAVTGACMATPRELFHDLGGFDERRFPISYNDIDYCFRVRSAGKIVAYEPGLTLIHHESKSRGLDADDPVKQERDEEEDRLLRQRWGDDLYNEPSVSPHWARFAPPFSALAMPSHDRITDHIRRSARPNPWMVSRVQRD